MDTARAAKGLLKGWWREAPSAKVTCSNRVGCAGDVPLKALARCQRDGIAIDGRGERMTNRQWAPTRRGRNAKLERQMARLHDDPKASMEGSGIKQAHGEQGALRGG